MLFRKGVNMTSDEKREIRLLQQRGFGYKKIAAHLGLSVNTVKSHIRRHSANENYDFNKGFCKQCGKRVPQHSKRKEKKFCSDKCRMTWWAAHPDMASKQSLIYVTCAYCGAEFRSRKSQKRKYCSRNCYFNARRGEA